MSTAIYIVSDPYNESIGRYKVGSHTGSRDKLLSRYVTYLPDAKIFYFREVIDALGIENIIKQICISKRVININGSISEWYNMELSHLIKVIDDNIGDITIFNNLTAKQTIDKYNILVNIDIYEAHKLFKSEARIKNKMMQLHISIIHSTKYKLPLQEIFMKYRNKLVKIQESKEKHLQYRRDLKSSLNSHLSNLHQQHVI